MEKMDKIKDTVKIFKEEIKDRLSEEITDIELYNDWKNRFLIHSKTKSNYCIFIEDNTISILQQKLDAHYEYKIYKKYTIKNIDDIILWIKQDIFVLLNSNAKKCTLNERLYSLNQIGRSTFLESNMLYTNHEDFKKNGDLYA